MWKRLLSLFGKKLDPLPNGRIRHEHFSLDLPESVGPWRSERAPADGVVLSATAPRRNCFVSLHLFQDGLSREDREQAFIELFRVRVQAETRVGGGGGLSDHVSDLSDPVWTAQYVRDHPKAGRTALCRLVADSRRALVLYYEGYGISKPAFDAEASAVSQSFVIPAGC